MSGSYPDQVVRLTADEVRQLADRIANAARPPVPPRIRWWQVALTPVLGRAPARTRCPGRSRSDSRHEPSGAE